MDVVSTEFYPPRDPSPPLLRPPEVIIHFSSNTVTVEQGTCVFFSKWGLVWMHILFNPYVLKWVDVKFKHLYVNPYVREWIEVKFSLNFTSVHFNTYRLKGIHVHLATPEQGGTKWKIVDTASLFVGTPARVRRRNKNMFHRRVGVSLASLKFRFGSTGPGLASNKSTYWSPAATCMPVIIKGCLV